MARFFVNRPIVAIVISIITVLLGVVAMSGLPISQYPEVVPPMIQVTTTFIGASATDVEASVATPLEQKINGVENMIYMKSTNANDGTLTLKVSFEVGSNLDMNNVLTQNRVSEGMPQMPQSVKNYGVSVKKALAFPLLVISIKSPKGTYDSAFLSNYTTININDAIARIQGVGQINLFGGSDYAMRVWLRPDVIGRLGITIPDIANAIAQQNQLTPAGQIGGPPAATGTEYTYTVRTQGRLLNEDEFSNIIVRTNPDGSEVRLKDIARLELGTMLYNSIGRHDGTPSAVIAVFQIPGTNALDVANRIKATMEDLKQRFPRDMDYLVSLDTTLPITEGITEIEHTLFEAVGLVIIVVFIFLQNWRATLIPLMTVPVSLVGAFMFFPLLGFSINVLSLLGLVLAIGIVVDDAIVVVEAVMHHIEHGMAPKEATIKAMEEVSGPVVAIGLILAAVFVPVGFMGGITGLLYQQFAITIAISVLLSVVNALTLSPALAALLLKPATGKKSFLTPFYNGFNRVFGWSTDRYVSFAGILARKMVRSLAFIGILIYATVMLVQRIPGGFVPEEDQGYILVNALLPDAASLERTDAVMRKAEAILEKNEAVEGFNTITGYSLLTGAYSSNMGFFFVQLKPWEERTTEESHANGVLAALNRGVRARHPGSRRGGLRSPGNPGARHRCRLHDGAAGPQRWIARLSGAAGRALHGGCQEAARDRPDQLALSGLRAADLRRHRPEQGPEVGRPLNDVNTTLGALLGSSYVNDFNRFGRVYKVYVQAEPEFRQDPKQLGLFFVKNQKGGMVPLDTLVTTGPSNGPEFTNRFNLFRTAELTGVPAAGYSSTQALDALEETAREVLPPDVTFDWADLSFQERRAPGVATVFALAIFLVFLILAAQYESWGLPFSVLLGTPFAAFGAYLGLYLARAVPGPELREQRLRADRTDHAHWSGREERDPDRRVREDGARGGKAAHGGDDVGGEASLPPDPDDGLRVHPRCRSAADRVRRRRRRAQGDGDDRLRGHARRDHPGRLPDSDVVRGRREGDWRLEAACSRRPPPCRPVAGDRARAGGSLRCSTVASARLVGLSRLRVAVGRMSPSVPTTRGRRCRARSSSASSKARRRSRWPTRPGSRCSTTRRCRTLIKTAIANNLDLRAAVARVEEARARAGIAKSFLYPQVDGGASYALAAGVERASRRRLDDEDTTHQSGAYGFQLSWELDLFGQLRRRERSRVGPGAGERAGAAAACWSRSSAMSRRTTSCCASSTCSSTSRDRRSTSTTRRSPTSRTDWTAASRTGSSSIASVAYRARTAAAIPRTRTADRHRRERDLAAPRPTAGCDRARSRSRRRAAAARHSAGPSGLAAGAPAGCGRRPSSSWSPANADIGVAKAMFYPDDQPDRVSGWRQRRSHDVPWRQRRRSGPWALDSLQPIFQAGRLRRNIEVDAGAIRRGARRCIRRPRSTAIEKWPTRW